MTRSRQIRSTLLGLCASAAVAGGIAHAHGDYPHPVVSGPETGRLGVLQLNTEHYFGFGGKITLDCPPPEGGDPCPVTVTVKTQNEYRFRKGQEKKIRTLGRKRFTLKANRDGAELHPVFLREKGDKILTRHGPYLKATVRVKIVGKEAIIRNYRMTLKDHAD